MSTTGCLPGFERAGNIPVSTRKTSGDVGSIDAISGFKSGVAKGIDSTEPLASPHGCGDAVFLASKEKGWRNSTPLAAKGLYSTQTLSVRAIDFRVSAFIRSLDPVRRADVARRARFYTLPWICSADELGDDLLP